MCGRRYWDLCTRALKTSTNEVRVGHVGIDMEEGNGWKQKKWSFASWFLDSQSTLVFLFSVFLIIVSTAAFVFSFFPPL
jgi:hypothetical protein